MPNYVPSIGNADADLAFVGEAPGRLEDELCEPFVGPSGELLDRNLVELGLARSEVWLANISKYKLDDNDFSKCNLRECMPILIDELREIKPNCIMLLGDNVLRAFTKYKGITNWRGSILRSQYNQKVIPTFHPAMMLYEGLSPYNELLFKMDIEKGLRESKHPRIPIDTRHITICKSPYDLFCWLRSEKNREYVSVDIEVIKSIPICIGIGFSRHRSIVTPLFQSVIGYKLTEMSTTEIAKCLKMVADVLAKVPTVGQNFKFDQEKLEVLGFQFSFYTSRHTAHGTYTRTRVTKVDGSFQCLFIQTCHITRMKVVSSIQSGIRLMTSSDIAVKIFARQLNFLKRCERS